ncbi:hypothetical protein LX36DRAFT_359019 [Colletotrichum falcatum]|nr:hypothetical protein LX36DRAFT_359019 [Colletotrichum falcatum]
MGIPRWAGGKQLEGVPFYKGGPYQGRPHGYTSKPGLQLFTTTEGATWHISRVNNIGRVLMYPARIWWPWPGGARYIRPGPVYSHLHGTQQLDLGIMRRTRGGIRGDEAPPPPPGARPLRRARASRLEKVAPGSCSVGETPWENSGTSHNNNDGRIPYFIRRR